MNTRKRANYNKPNVVHVMIEDRKLVFSAACRERGCNPGSVGNYSRRVGVSHAEALRRFHAGEVNLNRKRRLQWGDEKLTVDEAAARLGMVTRSIYLYAQRHGRTLDETIAHHREHGRSKPGRRRAGMVPLPGRCEAAKHSAAKHSASQSDAARAVAGAGFAGAFIVERAKRNAYE